MSQPSNPRPLPARAPPRDGESLQSVVRRTSAAMGYESPRRVLALLADQGPLPPYLNQLGPGRALYHLASLLRQSPERLLALTVHPFASSLVLSPSPQASITVCDSATTQRYFSIPWPVCPQCLQQDPVPYERLVWSFRPAPVCLAHGCLLVFHCHACHKSLRWDRLDARHCLCGEDLAKGQGLPVGTEVIRQAGLFHQMLLRQVTPLPGMPPAACFWWCERLAAAIERTPEWPTQGTAPLNLPTPLAGRANAWLAAVDMLCDWPQRLERFLDVFQKIDKQRTTSTGVGRRFGRLLRHAAQLEQFGYPAPADALRQYLLRDYAGGHVSGKVCLFRKPEDQVGLRRRAWISQTAAAKLLGLRHAAVAELMQRELLTGQIHPAGKQGRSVGLVLRASAEALKQELANALGVPEIVQRWGVGRRAVLEMIHRSLLPGAIRTARGWRIPRKAVTQRESSFENLPPKLPGETGWISLRQATRKFGPSGLTLGRLLALIHTGKVAARIDQDPNRLSGLVAAEADLAREVLQLEAQRRQSRGYPLYRLGKILLPGRPLKPAVLKKWIAAGLLKARLSGRARVVMPEEAARFRADYCLADEACRILNITRSTLTRWEVLGRIRPVYGKRLYAGAGCSLFRRCDLAELTRRRDPVVAK